MLQSGAIQINQLVKRFGDFEAVAGIDLQAPPGAFLALLGPSGCGKTTTLRMLAGLENPSAGEIYLNGRLVADGLRGTRVPAGQRDAGMVFQSYALWPHMTIYKNVEWPLKVRGWRGRRRHERVRQVLTLLDIDALADRYPGEISGGQQQRAAIARTLGPNPKFLFFDEPLSNLDAKLRTEMRSELLRVHRLSGATSVYVTHDQVEAMTMATHIAVMNQGHIEQLGTPRQLLQHPQTPFVANFIGTPPANVLRAQVQGGQYIYKHLALGQAKGIDFNQTPLLMYRADDLRLRFEPGARRLPVALAEITPVAGRAIVTVWENQQRLNVLVDHLLDGADHRDYFVEFPDQPTIVYKSDYDRYAFPNTVTDALSIRQPKVLP